MSPNYLIVLNEDKHVSDLDEAKRFLETVCGKPPYCFQTFDDSILMDRKMARVRFGSLEEHAEELIGLNRQGAGVFCTPNIVTGDRRISNNVSRVTSLWADQDQLNAPRPQFGIEPHIVVESSPGKFHYYWLVDNCPLDQFKPAQKRIAQLCHSDSTVCDLARVMRLPGFFHLKSEPFMTRIVEWNLDA